MGLNSEPLHRDNPLLQLIDSGLAALDAGEDPSLTLEELAEACQQVQDGQKTEKKP